MSTEKSRMPSKRLIIAVALTVGLVVALVFGTRIWETNNAGFVQVKQAFYSGTLTVHNDPGTYGELFGHITTYPEADTFHFTADTETGEARDQSLPTQFNDGAKAKVSGSVRVLLPNTDSEAMIRIHRKFKDADGVMNRLVLPAMRKALFASGPHMSAAESYAERRNEFATLIEDQLLYGTIATEKKPITKVDEISGKEKISYVLEKIPCVPTTKTVSNYTCVNGFEREQASVFREFGIQLTNFVIDDINYCPVKDAKGKCPVLEQIETQRKARMNIITQQAEAKEADARAKKAEAEARAQVAETRATEEVAKTQMIVRAEADKAKAVLDAQRLKEVAQLEKEAAEFEKKKQILLGEGEATRKKLVMQADGALQVKGNFWLEGQKVWAEAYKTRNVPQIVFGDGGSSRGAGYGDAGVQQLFQMLAVKAAKDLDVDLDVKSK